MAPACTDEEHNLGKLTNLGRVLACMRGVGGSIPPPPLPSHVGPRGSPLLAVVAESPLGAVAPHPHAHE